jgi:chlorophyllase
MRPLPLLLLLAACGPSPSRPPSSLPRGIPYRAVGNPWLRGPLEVVTVDLSEGEAGAPKPLRIHAPAASGTYALVQFQHGFTADVRGYDELLGHVASHGFVVVAPQMYPADGIPLGKPKAAWEAEDAAEVARWTQSHAAAVAGSASDGRPLALVGHSRGGKVAWLVSKSGDVPLRGLVGVDPVDGTGSALLAAQDEALPAPLTEGPPSLVIGMELGGACAPEGDNHVHFYERAAPPIRHAVVAGHGHGDMLDLDVDSGGLCLAGPDRRGAVDTVAGLVTAQLRVLLQGDSTMGEVLERGEGAPLEVTFESR